MLGLSQKEAAKNLLRDRVCSRCGWAIYHTNHIGIRIYELVCHKMQVKVNSYATCSHYKPIDKHER